MKTPTPMRIGLQGWALISLLILLPGVQAQTVQPTWTQLFPAGSPVEREAHSAVYDEAHNRMIIFGGRNNSGSFNDAWILSNTDGLGGSPSTSWIPITSSVGPSPRAFHSAVYDSANNRMIVFGGEPSSNDVWVLSNANGLEVTPAAWTQLSPTGAIPSRRLGHSAVYDAANNRLIIFGGEMSLGVFSVILDDIWVLSNANGLGGTPTWTQLSPVSSAGAPMGREMHSAIYDAAHNRMVVFGGFASNYMLAQDVWVLSNANGLGGTPAAWTQLSPTGAIPSRDLHSAVYDTSTNRMTVFGGIANFAFANDVWVLSNANGLGGTPAWTQLTPTGGPSAREGHSAVYHSATNSMIVFGGRLVQGWAKDVWVLSSGAPDLITVQILIKPGEDSHPATIEIEPGNEELIAVAILSSPTFNPLTMVDRTSLTFGRIGNEPSLAFCYDSSQDDEPRVGMHALICNFSIQKAGFQPADSIGVLKGKTLTGTSFRGTDSIRIEAEGDK